MNGLLIKNGTLVSIDDGYNYDKADILIQNGVIQEVRSGIQVSHDITILDATDRIVSPGFIDIHAHCFSGISDIGIDADEVGIKRGTTTLIDAGSAGPLTFERFKKEVIETHKTRVFSLLNISKMGLIDRHELDDLNKIDLDLVRKVVRSNEEFIVGLKARASSSVCGDLELLPIQMAADVAKELNQILMIHTGNFPPYLQDVLNLMKAGDILTHAFHGKQGGILGKNRQVIDEAILARKRGVLFDVGHGSASFSFSTFKRAGKLGFYPDFISTDIHCENYNGPVYSQHAVITKLINLGENLEEMIKKATSAPADHFKLDGLGHIKKGYKADLTISKISRQAREVVFDSMGEGIRIDRKFSPVNTIISRDERSVIIDNE